MVEAKAKLQATKQRIRIGKIGLQGGLFVGFTQIDIRSLEDAVVKYVAAQAIEDGLASTEEQLAIRDILPDVDFEDNNGNTITRREWVQPVSGGYQTSNTDMTIYTTNKDVDNTLKVYCFYGIRGTGRGPGDTASVLDVSSIQFDRSNSKTIDIWQVEQIDTVPDRVGYARTPILFRKGDNASIKFRPKQGISGNTDNLILLGKVAESLGKLVNG
jgi:hypothetical protein